MNEEFTTKEIDTKINGITSKYKNDYLNQKFIDLLTIGDLIIYYIIKNNEYPSQEKINIFCLKYERHISQKVRKYLINELKSILLPFSNLNINDLSEDIIGIILGSKNLNLNGLSEDQKEILEHVLEENHDLLLNNSYEFVGKIIENLI